MRFRLMAPVLALTLLAGTAVPALARPMTQQEYEYASVAWDAGLQTEDAWVLAQIGAKHPEITADVLRAAVKSARNDVSAAAAKLGVEAEVKALYEQLAQSTKRRKTGFETDRQCEEIYALGTTLGSGAVSCVEELSAEENAIFWAAVKLVGADMNKAWEVLNTTEYKLDKALEALGADLAKVKELASTAQAQAEEEASLDFVHGALNATLETKTEVLADDDEKEALVSELKLVNAMLTSQPDDGRLLLKAARLQYLLGNFPEAGKAALAAAAKLKNPTPALVLGGLAAQKAGKDAIALQALKTAVEQLSAGSDATDEMKGYQISNIKGLVGILEAAAGDTAAAQADLEAGLVSGHRNEKLLDKLKDVYKQNEQTSDLKIFVAGKAPKFDVKPQIINGRTVVPLRAIVEALGAKVDWDAVTRTITVTKEKDIIKLTLDSDTAYVNGEAKQLQAAAQSVDGRTMVPLRFLGENFHSEVSYDAGTRLILINPQLTPPTQD